MDALPNEVRIGDGFSKTVSVGRHEDNQIVLPLTSVSRVHCQLALRKFQLPGQVRLHEALFLCDMSSHGTLVNGVPAHQPWQWLRMGDKIGICLDRSDPNSLAIIYKVHYRTLRTLSASVTSMPATLAASSQQVTQSSAGARKKETSNAPKGQSSRKAPRKTQSSAPAPLPAPELPATVFWLCCDECEEWHVVEESVHNFFESRDWTCEDIGMPCKKKGPPARKQAGRAKK